MLVRLFSGGGVVRYSTEVGAWGGKGKGRMQCGRLALLEDSNDRDAN